MQDNVIPLSRVEKISTLIDALRDYAFKSARACCERQLTEEYQAPSLSTWNAFMWFDLVPDWEIVAYLVSGTDRTKVLVKSLQSCLQWYE
jgi:hypothetical protein